MIGPTRTSKSDDKTMSTKTDVKAVKNNAKVRIKSKLLGQKRLAAGGFA